MNPYIKMQIQNIISMVETFEKSCVMAATQDDGTIDHDEAKAIKQINKASEHFLKELGKIKLD